VRKAFRIAQLEKPGPTHVELPEDIAAAAVADDAQPLDPTLAYFPEPTDEAISHAARLLAASNRPLVLAGNGVIRQQASVALRELAVGLQARDHVLSGFDRADLVVSVGYDLVEYAPARWNPDGRKRIIHIDTQ